MAPRSIAAFCQFGHEPAPEHDQHAVAQGRQLVDLGRDQHDPDAVGRDRADQLADLGLRAHIDADGRLVHDEDARLGAQPLGEQDLLLVAAAERADRRLRPGRTDPQPA